MLAKKSVKKREIKIDPDSDSEGDSDSDSEGDSDQEREGRQQQRSRSGKPDRVEINSPYPERVTLILVQGFLPCALRVSRGVKR